MFFGMLLGVMFWYAWCTFVVILDWLQSTCTFDDNTKQQQRLIVIIIFAFIGSIIGYLINLNISFTWSM